MIERRFRRRSKILQVDSLLAENQSNIIINLKLTSNLPPRYIICNCSRYIFNNSVNLRSCDDDGGGGG